MKVVIKFGGTSIATVKDIRNVVEIVSTLSTENKLVVVCSAVDGITAVSYTHLTLPTILLV